MDFWQAQKRARTKTKIYVTVFVAITLVVALAIEFIMRKLEPNAYNPHFPFLGAFFVIITFIIAGFNYSMYQSFGGHYVAKSIGAKPVDPNTINPQEQMLLNIVQEMAIASAIPTPPIYIIPAKQINAFAAGMNRDNAVIAISEGALNRLSRPEIQGVIAHEFGHIYNGDMKISMRLAAMVMGFMFVFYVGLRVMQFSTLSSRRSQGKGGNPLALAALLFLIAGIFTWLCGSILKACISREREYLADACSVQFTRNPSGIAGALREIAKEQFNDMPANGAAFSHMYLDNHIGFNSLFATHPSIRKRIEAIEGRKYIPEWEEWQKHTS